MRILLRHLQKENSEGQRGQAQAKFLQIQEVDQPRKVQEEDRRFNSSLGQTHSQLQFKDSMETPIKQDILK